MVIFFIRSHPTDSSLFPLLYRVSITKPTVIPPPLLPPTTPADTLSLSLHLHERLHVYQCK